MRQQQQQQQQRYECGRQPRLLIPDFFLLSSHRVLVSPLLSRSLFTHPSDTGDSARACLLPASSNGFQQTAATRDTETGPFGIGIVATHLLLLLLLKLKLPPILLLAMPKE
jgi:hypothetical protein